MQGMQGMQPQMTGFNNGAMSSMSPMGQMGQMGQMGMQPQQTGFGGAGGYGFNQFGQQGVASVQSPQQMMAQQTGFGMGSQQQVQQQQQQQEDKDKFNASNIFQQMKSGSFAKDPNAAPQTSDKYDALRRSRLASSRVESCLSSPEWGTEAAAAAATAVRSEWLWWRLWRLLSSTHAMPTILCMRWAWFDPCRSMRARQETIGGGGRELVGRHATRRRAAAIEPSGNCKCKTKRTKARRDA